MMLLYNILLLLLLTITRKLCQPVLYFVLYCVPNNSLTRVSSDIYKNNHCHLSLYLFRLENIDR